MRNSTGDSPNLWFCLVLPSTANSVCCSLPSPALWLRSVLTKRQSRVYTVCTIISLNVVILDKNNTEASERKFQAYVKLRPAASVHTDAVVRKCNIVRINCTRATGTGSYRAINYVLISWPTNSHVLDSPASIVRRGARGVYLLHKNTSYSLKVTLHSLQWNVL